MIDLHCHLLPGIDDGARDLDMALEMARMYATDGVEYVACTPHILPGLYQNSGPSIRLGVENLQKAINEAGIRLQLYTGADNHVVANFVQELQSGHLLALSDTRYVLVEPPHHVLPPRLEDLFFNLVVNGYVPILTHPERLSWLPNNYSLMQRLVDGGSWMQLTSGSLTGNFGRNAQYWAERMLSDGIVHVLATDSHDTVKRPPVLSAGRVRAAELIGEVEAEHLVWTRPAGILNNIEPHNLPPPPRGLIRDDVESGEKSSSDSKPVRDGHGLLGRVRRFFE